MTIKLLYTIDQNRSSLIQKCVWFLYTVERPHLHIFILKGLVHPKMKIVIYSPSCHPKPVRFSFIFRTQMKRFLMKYEIHSPATLLGSLC